MLGLAYDLFLNRIRWKISFPGHFLILFFYTRSAMSSKSRIKAEKESIVDLVLIYDRKTNLTRTVRCTSTGSNSHT